MKTAQLPRRSTARAPHLAIIGAGLSGLTAALYARARGYDVTILERKDLVGGRAATEKLAARVGDEVLESSFDTGATVWTMPSLLDDALASVGLTVTEIDPSFRVEQISPSYQARFASGRNLDVFSQPEQMAVELERYGASSESVAGYYRLRTWLEQLFDASFENFMSRSFDHVGNLADRPSAARDLAQLLKLGAFGGLEQRIYAFLGNPELTRVFSFQALYAGVAPRKARAVYGCISHMDTSMGVYYPQSTRFESGMGTVSDLLAAAAKNSGCDIRFNAEVSAIETTTPTAVSRGVGRPSNKVTALVLADGSRIDVDAVISTADLEVTQKYLTAEPDSENTAGKTSASKASASETRRVPLRYSPSAVVAHGFLPVSVTSNWPKRHHTISFGEKWDETFTEIAAPRHGQLMSDPSLLITRASVSAPQRIITDKKGNQWEPVSVLAPCPNLQSAPLDWSHITDSYVAEVLTELDARGFAGIAEHFVLAKVDTPQTWADQDMSVGTPFGLAHLFRQTGPFRPRNLNPKLPTNLILAGSTTVPGVGVPTVMISGRLAAERLRTVRQDD